MEEINEPVAVAFVSYGELRSAKPVKVKWRNRIYMVTEICMHQILPEKGIPHHIYSIVAGTCHMILSMNSQTLLWNLKSIGSII